jgi:D-glycero-D-manno-heptose 1,7-bisphosphate phosphatase
MIKTLIDSTWTLFLDRDGVINERIFGGYITKKEDFIFKRGVVDFLRFATKRFYKIIVVTNQQGVGKGLMSDDELSDIHQFMINEVEAKKGRIDAVFSAVNLKSDSNNHRKPLPFMAYQAKNKFQEIDFSKSIMIGDTDSDLIFGKNLGMKTILVKTDEAVTEEADLIVENLNELIY